MLREMGRHNVARLAPGLATIAVTYGLARFAISFAPFFSVCARSFGCGALNRIQLPADYKHGPCTPPKG